jgi:hypothetical protein
VHIQWEYQAFQISGGSLIQGLNKVGEDGWQAIEIQHARNHELVICKRPKSLLSAMPDLAALGPQAFSKDRS